MATPQPTPAPRFGRGRGGGIRLNSLTAISYTQIPIPNLTAKHATIFKDFFSLRKSKKSPRHKLSVNLNSLHTSPYATPIANSQNSHLCKKSIMPSPVDSSASQPQLSTQSTLSSWTTVPKRKSSAQPPVAPTNHASKETTSENTFDILSDDDDADVLTDMSPVDFQSDDSQPRPSRSARKQKKKKPKSLKKRRQSKSRGVLPSDSSMDSGDDIPPKRYSHTKLSATQQHFIDDSSTKTSDQEISHSLTSPSPDPAADLEDSDLEKNDPKMKNSDIRSFYTKSTVSSKSTSQLKKVPIRDRIISKETCDVTIATYPPRSLVEILYKSKQFPSHTYLEHLQALSYKQIRQQFAEYFQSLLQSSSDPQIPYQSQSFGFFDRTTLDWEIASLGHNESMTIILGIKDFNKSLHFCDFENLQSMHELLKITRDTLLSNSSKVHFNLWTTSKQEPVLVDLTADDSQAPTINLDFSHKNQGGLQAVPTPTETDQSGININMMMARSISPSPLRPPPTNPTIPAPPPVSLTQFSARFDISPNNATAINVPLVARQLFRIFKKADRTLRLLPWFQDHDSDIESIDQEEDIPTSEDAVKQWVDNPHIHNNRLLFAMRIECIAKPKHIRDTFVPWMMKNNSHIKLDKLAAQEIYGVGFISEIHPHFYNRTALKQFIQDKLHEHDTNLDINVYVRRVWNTHQKVKVIAKGVVLEVAKENKDIAANALMNIDFSLQYRYAKFIPFNKSIVDDETLNNILISNNSYQQNTRRRIIKGLTSIYDDHSTLDNQQLSIRDWLLSIDNNKQSPNQEYIFEHVETSVNNDTVLIYASHYQDTVQDFLNHFEAHLRGIFVDPNSFFQSSVPFSTGTSSSPSNSEYGRKIAALYATNPQEASTVSPSPPRPKKLYYGAADSAPDTYMNHLMKPKSPAKKSPAPSKKTAPPRQPPPTQPAPSPQPPQIIPASQPDSSLLARISQLEESTSKLSSSIDARFEAIERQKEQDKSAMITAVTTAVTNVMTSSLPQIISEQLKVATTSSGGETL